MPDEHLRELYTERTQHYIAMYEEMIGPYPYAKFATVENWFPTGYGMPSFTFLGDRVMEIRELLRDPPKRKRGGRDIDVVVDRSHSRLMPISPDVRRR